MACSNDTSSLSLVLHKMIRSEELKKDTDVTRNIMRSVEKLIEMEVKGNVRLKELRVKLNEAFVKIFKFNKFNT